MRNFLSSLARALKGAVSLPFWIVDHAWDAFKIAWRPRAAETDYAAEQAQNVVAAEPFDEMGAVVAALRIVIVNSKQDIDDAMPMKLEGIDSRWSQWLSRIQPSEAQRALNAASSRPGSLEAHRSGAMPMLGIPRVKTDVEYEREEKDALDAVREEFLAPFRAAQLINYASTSCHPFPYCFPTEPEPEPEPEEQHYGMRR